MTLLEIYESMLEYGEREKDRIFTPADLTKVLRQFVSTGDIKVKMHRDSNVDMDQIIVGGHYDPHEDEANCSSITIYASYNPAQTTIKIAEMDWPQLCVDLIECSGHEIVHQEQYRARDFDIGPTVFISGNEDEEVRKEQEYLGNPDEVDAYGFSIAIEVFLKERPKKLNSNHVMKTATYKLYKNTFGVQHPVVKQLLVNTIKYYSKITNGGAYV